MCEIVEHSNIDRKTVKRLALLPQSSVRRTPRNTPFFLAEDDLSQIPSAIHKILDQRPYDGPLLVGIL